MIADSSTLIMKVSMGISVAAAVVPAAVLGFGIVVMVMLSREYSQMITKHKHLKEKCSCVSKSANKVQKLIPELKTTVECMFDEIKKWTQKEAVKNKLEELRSSCEKQR